MTYDNEETVASKVRARLNKLNTKFQKKLLSQTKYVLESGLGGVMVWSIDTDDFLGLYGNQFSLLSSIYRTINDG